MSNKKQINKEIRAKYAKQEEIKQNPDLCFCDDPEYDDEPIGQTEPVDGFPYWNSTGFTEPIYFCKKCGKKHIVKLAY
jgi:hypothetical protein